MPLKIYLTAKGLVKVELGLARGKKLHDKRSAMKQRDAERSIQRALRQDDRD